MTVFQEQSILLGAILLMLILIFFRLGANRRAADRRALQIHSDAQLIAQYLIALRKQLASLTVEP